MIGNEFLPAAFECQGTSMEGIFERAALRGLTPEESRRRAWGDEITRTTCSVGGIGDHNRQPRLSIACVTDVRAMRGWLWYAMAATASSQRRARARSREGALS